MEAALEHLHQDVERMKLDIETIKQLLLQEGELTPWAKQELAKARAAPLSDYVPLD